MAFTSEGSLGATATKRSVGFDGNVTTSLNPSRDVDVGQIIVVWLAADETSAPSTPGTGSLYERMACHDSQGNVYSTIVAGYDGGGGNSFMMGAIFVTRVARALDTADTITVTHRAMSGGGSSAISVEEFSCDGDLRWALAERATHAGRAIDPSSITLISLDSDREYLFLHYLAVEGPDSDAYTWDADYTQITGVGTTGGTDDSNAHLRGGYRIVDGLTSDTVDVTSDTADRDWTQGLACITEIVWDPEFPAEPVLDDFNRANEDPLSQAGRWNPDDSAGPSAPTPSLLRVDGNVARGSGSGGGGSWWWDELQAGETDGETYVTIATKGGAHVTFNGSGAAENSTADGLAAMWELEGGPTAIRARDLVRMGSAGNAGGVDQTRLLAWVDCADGVKFGIQVREPAEHLWIDVGGGWEWVAAASPRPGFAPGGRLGLGASDGTVRLDDFGGGPVSMWEIMRRTSPGARG